MVARQRGSDERGATLVEFAVIAPMLVLIFIGTMEIGLAFYDYLTVGSATREGSRLAAFLGDTPDADCTIAQEVHAELGGLASRMDEIQIYKANDDGTRDIFKTNVWELIGDPADCNLGWNVTELWPASTRNVTYDPANPLDIIGVRVRVDRQWITGFPPFRGAYDVDQSRIIRLEPEAFA